MLFGLKLEADIKYIYFFKGTNTKEEVDDDLDDDDFVNKSKMLLKKNYIFVTTDNKLVIKNLGIRKKSNSALSKKIFQEYLVPEIIKGKIKFSKKYITDLINELLQKDISLAFMRKEVGNIDQYKKSETSLPAQICKKYGSGIHFLIPNIKGIGVGKGKSFCTKKEFDNNHLTYKDIDTENVLSELGYFIMAVPQRDIFSY